MPTQEEIFEKVQSALVEALGVDEEEVAPGATLVGDLGAESIDFLDIVFRLAEDYGIVLLNGGGFEAPDWSVRVSFANLDDHVYDDIGRAVRAIARGYVQAYEASKSSAAKGKKAKAKPTKARRA